jgi:DNA-binding response OmpR family regulator
MPGTILVVDDDRKTAEIIRLYLERDGHQVLIAYDGQRALDLVRQHRPDLLVLDLMLPAIDGVALCRLLRAESAVPIIMLTARTTEDDVLTGLDAGADDYIAKPFSPRQVAARVRAVLRRSARAEPRPTHLWLGALEIDCAGYAVRLHGRPVHLTPKEFRLLEVLAREPGRTFSRLELLERVFGLEYDGADRTVDMHIMNLRRKIERDPANPIFIQTVYGVGYKFGVDNLQL